MLWFLLLFELVELCDHIWTDTSQNKSECYFTQHFNRSKLILHFPELISCDDYLWGLELLAVAAAAAGGVSIFLSAAGSCGRVWTSN